LNPNLVAPQQLAADRAFPPLSPLGKTPTPSSTPLCALPRSRKNPFPRVLRHWAIISRLNY